MLEVWPIPKLKEKAWGMWCWVWDALDHAGREQIAGVLFPSFPSQEVEFVAHCAFYVVTSQTSPVPGIHHIHVMRLIRSSRGRR